MGAKSSGVMHPPFGATIFRQPTPTEKPMTPLRQKMEADLRLRNLASSTSEVYVGNVARYARYFRRCPSVLGALEARTFLLHLADLGRAPATRVTYHAALRFVYSETLGRPEVMATVPRPRVRAPPPRLPLVREEVSALLEAVASSPFDYTLISTLLATGLRVSEACHLRSSDIDSRSGLIHVRCGKGAKPRSVKLGGKHLRLLRRYRGGREAAGVVAVPRPASHRAGSGRSAPPLDLASLQSGHGAHPAPPGSSPRRVAARGHAPRPAPDLRDPGCSSPAWTSAPSRCYSATPARTRRRATPRCGRNSSAGPRRRSRCCSGGCPHRPGHVGSDLKRSPRRSPVPFNGAKDQRKATAVHTSVRRSWPFPLEVGEGQG